MNLLFGVIELAQHSKVSRGGVIASSEFRRQAVDASSRGAKFVFRNSQYRQRPEPESFFSNLHCEGRRMRAAAIIFAVLVGFIVTAVGMSEMYVKCGPPCWQGLLQAQRDRF
jgi:hypothetical protein